MSTLSNLFLHSARMYSSLADAVFGDSVEQSQFASTVSSMRMQATKAITGTPLDIKIELGDEDMEILTAGEGWPSCLALDNHIMRVMAAHDEQKFLPLLMGIYTAAHRGAAYASQADDRPKHKKCLSCGSISEQWQCPVCDSGKNWLVGVEVPENTEEIGPEDNTDEVSLPNLSFGDFAPEMPAFPKRWEVFFGGKGEDDIFQATGLVRPTL